jgi:general secretion pathway protein M
MLRRGSLVGRLLAVTLLFLALWVLWQVAVGPVVASYRTTAEEITNARALLERYRGLAALRPRLVEQLGQQREEADESTSFLAGATDALAAAAMQDHARTIIDAADGELRSTQILPAKPADETLGIQRAGLRLQFTTAIDGLQRILYDLETAEPYLFVDEIAIREQRTRRRRRDEPETAPTLDVTLQLYGFVRPRDTAEGRSAGA